MTGSVSKRKGTKRFSKRNINVKTKDSTAVATGSIKLRNVDNVMKLQRDSDDSDYVENLPLIYVKEGLKDISQGDSSIGLKTRKPLHQKNVVLCEKQGELLYLEDYERVSDEVHEKSICFDKEALFPGYRKKHQKSKFTQKKICNEQLLIKRNVNDGRRTSTPK